MSEDPDQLFQTALAGDPAPLASAFREPGELATPLMRMLLEAPEDAPVAACFARMWAEIGPDISDARALYLRWYLSSEAAAGHPVRAAVHRDALTRFLFLPWFPQSDLGCDLVFGAVRAATNEPSPLALHARAQAVLERVAREWLADPAHPATESLLYAAISAANLGVLRDAIARAETHERDRELNHAIDWALSSLIAQQGGVDESLAALIRREFERDPENPPAVQRFAWLSQQEGARFADLVGFFHKMRQDPSEPQLRQALFYAQDQSHQNQLGEDEDRFSETLLGVVDDWVPDDKSEIIAARDFPAGPEPGDDLARLFDIAQGLTEIDLGLGVAHGPDAVRSAYARLVEAIEAAPVPEDWTLLRFLQASEALRQLARREFSWVAHFIEAPHAQGRPEYGRLDLHMFPAVTDGLFATSAAFARAGWAWVEAGRPLYAGWALAQLLFNHSDAVTQIDDVDTGLAFLDRVERHGLMPERIAVLRDNLLLRAGDTARAGETPPPMRRGSTVHPYLPHDAWSRAEGVHWQVLAQDRPIYGSFDVVWPDGTETSHAHETPERDVRWADAHDMSLLGESLIVGPSGTVLQPDAYHTSRDYPPESRVVLAGQKNAIRVRPMSEAGHDAPVILLEASAALHWPNYYHWMIPHLSRLALAMDRGLFDGRQLVVPEGLRPWILETLDLIGLTAERRLELPFGQLTRFSDSVILGSVEHLSPAAIAALRRRLMGPAAFATSPPVTGPFIYLSRGDIRDRSLDNAEEIEALAASMDFEVVKPEELGIKGQMELFSRARGIAGPEGAAMTNTLFAAPGARVLSILCVNEMLPIYNDLSLVLGHDHRKLAGRVAAGPGAGGRFQPRFEVDPGHARKALEWVRAGR